MSEPKKTFGGRQDGPGRPALPPEHRRSERVVCYVTPAVAAWIEQQGGSKAASEILAKACLFSDRVMRSENGGVDRGGRRPRIDGVMRLVKIPDDAWQHCRAQGNASEYIRRLIEADMAGGSGSASRK